MILQRIAYQNVVLEGTIPLYMMALGPVSLFIVFLIGMLLFFIGIFIIIRLFVGILLGNITRRFWRSIYLHSLFKFYIYEIRRTSIIRFIIYNSSKRIREGLVYRYSDLFYVYLLLVIATFSLGIATVILPYISLDLGEVGLRSAFWNLTQLHLTTIGVGLTVLVFSLSFLENNINRLEHSRLVIKELFLIRLIIISTILFIGFFSLRYFWNLWSNCFCYFHRKYYFIYCDFIIRY